jgi:FdhE protein
MPSTGFQGKEAVLKTTDTHLEPFREIIDRFALLLGRQAETRAALTPVDLGAFVVDEKRFLDGEPLVGFLDVELLAAPFRQAASRVWPVQGVIFPSLAEGLAVLGRRLEEDASWTSKCLRAVALGDAEALQSAAALAGVTPEFLLMALRAAYAPCIAAHKEAMASLAPVDLWRKAHCPVCGSDPDLAVLENNPEPSEFLVSKGGEVWHHCPTCSHRWRFVRLVCPGCGNQDHETLNRFSVPGAPMEYIYACDACRQYLPCLDLVERADVIDFDLAALKAVHLDAAAQASGYVPVSPAPWTALGFAEDKAKAS